MTVLCQWCGAANADSRENCHRCNSRLLVVSGETELTEQALLEAEEAEEREHEAFDEHLLERLSLSEEAAKRLASAVSALDDRVAELERSVSLLDAGVQALVDLLDRRKVLRESEIIAAWERAATTEMAREELLEKLRARREVIVSRARTEGPTTAAATARAVQAAELALLAGQPERAAAALAGALRRAQRNPELASLVGELAFERGDLEGAEAQFRRVLTWEPKNVEAHIYLGTILADTGREPEGREELERAVTLSPDSFLPHFALGALHAAANRFAPARAALTRALEREQLPQAHFLLGVVELESGHPGAAARAFEAAVDADPEFEDAIYYLGLAYLERGWQKRALECFRRVQELDPQRLQYQEAVRLIEAGQDGPLQLPPQAELLLREASRAADSGDLDGALHHLRRALRVTEHPSLLAFQALLAAAAGRHRLALSASHRLLRLEVRGAPLLAAWTALLETLRATRHFLAVEAWGTTLYRQGETPSERALAAYELALADIERGRETPRTLELAHEALDLMPRELRQYPLTALGRIHLAREEFSDSVDYLEQAAAISDSPAILSQLGLALLGAGQRERAREVLKRSREDAGRDLKTEVLTHLARVGWLAGHGRRKG